MNQPHRRRALALAMLAALGAPLPALAQDLAWSGFATLGYARSPDVPGRYLRWIDDNGSFDAASVAALQLDARFNPSWSATVQLKAAPSERADHRWDLRPAWAFLAWRPNDDWLLRGGRMRVPLYMHSESLDIGVAHSMARLPVEMYSLVPSNEFNGLSASYSRASTLLPDSELALDAYSGRSSVTARFWLRDGAPPVVPAGSMFVSVDLTITGLVATLRSPRTTLRFGLHEARTSRQNASTPVDYPFVPIGPGLGYYRVNEQLPGPPIASVSRIRNQVVTLGADHRFGDGWRLTAELARNQQFRTRLGSNTLGGYVALAKDIGDFTPYVSLGRLTTSSPQMDRYQRFTGDLLPAMVPGAAQINAAQRIAGESIYAADQTTWALGSAWRTPLGGTLKLEYGSVHIGEVSRLVDAPSGQPTPMHQRFGTWTLSYSVAY